LYREDVVYASKNGNMFDKNGKIRTGTQTNEVYIRDTYTMVDGSRRYIPRHRTMCTLFVIQKDEKQSTVNHIDGNN
jgi:hypothetical protein